MPDTSHLIKFAGAGKAAKFGAEFGKLMSDKVNDSVEAIRQKVAQKIAGIDHTGERGDGHGRDRGCSRDHAHGARDSSGYYSGIKLPGIISPLLEMCTRRPAISPVLSSPASR